MAPNLDRARDLAAVLREVGVETVLIGACAMAAAGCVRGSEDIDLAIAVQLPELKALAERLTRLSHSLSMNMVAKGVETAEQRDLLLGFRCDFGQGCLLGRPIQQPPFEAILPAQE